MPTTTTTTGWRSGAPPRTPPPGGWSLRSGCWPSWTRGETFFRSSSSCLVKEETTMIRKYLPIALLTLGLGALQAHAAHAADTDGLWIHIRVLDAKDGRVSINLPISVVERMGNVLPSETSEKGNGRLRFNDEDI